MFVQIFRPGAPGRKGRGGRCIAFQGLGALRYKIIPKRNYYGASGYVSLKL